MRIKRTSVYDKWFAKLKDMHAKSLINAKLLRIQIHGELFGDFKYVDTSIIELRFDTGPGYRVYLTMKENEIILLLIGGDKSSQRADIEKAKKLAQEWSGSK